MRGLVTLLFVFAACGPAPESHLATSEPVPIATPTKKGADHEVLARLAKERGVLDVAAEELGRAYEASKTVEAKRAFGVALAEAWAFERAREALADSPDELAKLPADASPIEPDAERIERVLSALAKRDGKAAREEIAPLVNPHAPPLVLELAGRARIVLGEPVEARRAFARARSRIDAAGGKIGMVATVAGAVDTLAKRGDRLLVARARERYLVGGYQSSNTHTMWVESYAIGDPDPLVRWPTGNTAGGVAVSADGHTIALADTPIQDLLAASNRIVQSARIFDARTGRETSSFGVSSVRNVTFGGPSTLLVGEEHDVALTDFLGHPSRTLAITGSTPSMMYAYRTNGTDDAIPTTYASQPATVLAAPNGTIAVGASDGAIWIWPSGNKPPFTMKPAPVTQVEQREWPRQPLVMRFDASGGAVIVAGADGGVTSWDLTTRKARVLVAPKCTDQEIANGFYGSNITPLLLAQCAQARSAGLSPDGSRAIFASLMLGPRVRDTKTGEAIAMLDTLEADAMAFDDAAGTQAWLGGVDGTIDHWNTQSGERIESLAQGGIAGFVQSVSSDGRFVVTMTPNTGYRKTVTPQLKVWDTTAHAPVATIAADLTQVHFISGSIAQVTTRSHGAFLFDLVANKRVHDLAPDDWYVLANESHDRFISLRAPQKIVVRDMRGQLREIDTGARADAIAIDRAARVVCTITDGSELACWNVDDGRELMRIPAGRGSMLAVSPEGKSVAWRSDAKTLVVTAIDDHHEIARLTSKDIQPAQDYSPIRGIVFTNETHALVIGPGGPGYERVYRWTVGETHVMGTELQVLGTERIELSASGIATIYDRNDSAYLVRASDGVLLASVHATRAGGWLAMSRDGAVDGSLEGRSAAVTNVEGASAARSSWLGWDRFEVPDLLAQSARGANVMPPMPALVARTVTLTQAH